jgi:hypothetical protein
MAQKTKAQRQKLARLLKEGTPVCEALLEAGWSETQARKGRGAIPKAVLRLLTPKVKKLLDLGNIDPDMQEKLTRGRLTMNVIEGSDKGVQSAKALGSDRRVNMFVPDVQQGIIVVVPPTSLTSMTPEQKKQLLEGDE